MESIWKLIHCRFLTRKIIKFNLSFAPLEYKSARNTIKFNDNIRSITIPYRLNIVESSDDSYSNEIDMLGSMSMIITMEFTCGNEKCNLMYCVCFSYEPDHYKYDSDRFRCNIIGGNVEIHSGNSANIILQLEHLCVINFNQDAHIIQFLIDGIPIFTVRTNEIPVLNGVDYFILGRNLRNTIYVTKMDPLEIYSLQNIVRKYMVKTDPSIQRTLSFRNQPIPSHLMII